MFVKGPGGEKMKISVEIFFALILKLKFLILYYSGWSNYYSHIVFVIRINSPNIDNKLSKFESVKIY